MLAKATRPDAAREALGGRPAEPSARDAGRSRVALLLLAPMAAVGAIGFAASWGADPGGMAVLPALLSLGAIASLVAGAWLAQRRHVVAGVGLAVAGMQATIWALYGIGVQGEATDSVLLYLAIPLLVAGLTMPPRWAVAATTLTVALVPVLGVRLRGGTVPDELLSILTLLALMGVIAVVSSVVQSRTMQALESRATEVARASAALRVASAERIRLLQQIAHDLGAPLTPIKLQLAVLAQRVRDPKDQASVQMLARNVRHLHTLVDDVKGLAVVEGEGFRLALKDVDLADCIRQCAEDLQAAAGERGVRLEAQAGASLPLRGDPVRLTQVLYNLAGNALKFTPPGGLVRIEGTTDGREVQVAVRDTGSGLTEEQMAKLFRPFAQVHDKAQQRVEDRGTGLGLYISKGIVEAHGGSIAVASQGPGTGAVFTFRLPVGGPGSRGGASDPASPAGPAGRA